MMPVLRPMTGMGAALPRNPNCQRWRQRAREGGNGESELGGVGGAALFVSSIAVRALRPGELLRSWAIGLERWRRPPRRRVSSLHFILPRTPSPRVSNSGFRVLFRVSFEVSP